MDCRRTMSGPSPLRVKKRTPGRREQSCASGALKSKIQLTPVRCPATGSDLFCRMVQFHPERSGVGKHQSESEISLTFNKKISGSLHVYHISVDRLALKR
jgi:hypothetical protein